MMDQEFRDDLIARLTRIETLTTTTNGSVKDHEGRIRKLEKIAAGLSGAWLVIAAWLKLHIMGGK